MWSQIVPQSQIEASHKSCCKLTLFCTSLSIYIYIYIYVCVCVGNTKCEMNRLKRYLLLSAMKFMHDSLVLSHLQFEIKCWGFEWKMIFRLQKRALRIMPNSKYNAHTDPSFRDLETLKVKKIFDVQCLKLWHKFVNNELPHFAKSMFTYRHELYETDPTATVCSISIPRTLLVPIMLYDTVYLIYYSRVSRTPYGKSAHPQYWYF